MKEHTATVHILTEEFERINRLLDIDSMEEMTDQELLDLGAEKYECETIYSVTFDDGSHLSFDLCSGSVNYYGDVIWTSADGKQEITLEPEFKLGDMEVDIESQVYLVHLIKD